MSEYQKVSLYDVLHGAHPDTKDRIFRDLLTERTMAARWPQNAVLELLPTCNLACKMCYIRMSPAQAEAEGGVMGFDEWKKIIDDCLAVGVMNFTLTGGECTLHPDFAKLYEYIYEHTACITIMTNAGLMTPALIGLLSRKKPLRVVITVYGSSRETYGALCGNAAAYDRVMWSLNALKENGIPFNIQMTVVKENIDDMAKIIRLAKEYDVRFNYMDSLTPFGEADENTVAGESADHRRVVEIAGAELPVLPGGEPPLTEEELVARRKAKGKPPRPGIRCNAARNTLVISWKGEMKPCTVLDAYKVSVKDKDFRKVWENMVAWADSLTVLPECYCCEYLAKCVSCVAQHYNDTHDFSRPSPRLCWKMRRPESVKE